jgi:hypothetical protein
VSCYAVGTLHPFFLSASPIARIRQRSRASRPGLAARREFGEYEGSAPLGGDVCLRVLACSPASLQSVGCSPEGCRCNRVCLLVFADAAALAPLFAIHLTHCLGRMNRLGCYWSKSVSGSTSIPASLAASSSLSS